MKKVVLRTLVALLALVLVCVAVFVGIYFTRFRTMSGIEKVSSYDDGYDLYTMDIRYDYDIDAIIDYGITDDQSMFDAIIKEALPLLPIKIKVPSFGCSAFTLEGTDGDVRMGRNYDFKKDTSVMLVHCAPKDGYCSVAFAALDNVSANAPTESLKKRVTALTAPFICLDGMNEKGVSVAVLVVDTDPVHQDTGKPTIFTTLAIRLVLDRAATTEEAVELLRSYDMYAPCGRDYHFYITDATGDGRVVEYTFEGETREMIDTPSEAVTNFYIGYLDQVLPDQHNGVYGHGRERYDAIMEILDDQKGAYTNETAWEALKAAAQDPNPESITSNTQWSIVFNDTDLTAEIVVRRNWNDVYAYDLKDNTLQLTEAAGPYDGSVSDADVWIDLPALRQYGGYTCGTTCVQMLMNWLFPEAGDINLAYLEEDLGTTDETGTTPDSILTYFRANGVSAETREGMTVSDLAAALDSGSPVMIALQAWSTAEDGSFNTTDPSDAETYLIEGHYVICVGYQKTGDGYVFYFNDPACVGHCLLTGEELDARWIDVDANGKICDHFGIVVSGKTAYDPNGVFHMD